MNDVMNSQLYYVITLLVIALFWPLSSNADFHIIYKNNKKEGEKLEIFLKNEFFKIHTVDNKIKIIDLNKNTVCIYTGGETKYLKFEIPEKSKKLKRKKKDFFNASLETTKEKGKVLKEAVNILNYSSEIDEKSKVYAAKGFADEDLEKLKSALEYIPLKGAEFIKSPPFFYALGAGYVSMRIKSKSMDWAASFVEKDELDNKIFEIPAEMTLWETKDYYRYVVDKASEEMDSRVKP